MVFAFVLTMNVAFAGFNMPSTIQTGTVIGSDNGVSSAATTGGNGITQTLTGGGAFIGTGAAMSSTVGVAAMNTNVAVNGGAMQTGSVVKSGNYVQSGAGTGTNGITQSMVMKGGATVVTGAAASGAKGISLMNTNVSVGCPCTTHCNTCRK